jgi:hypothetical protein
MEPRDIKEIDRFIERYADEREHTPKQQALQQLLFQAYLANDGREFDAYFETVRKLVLINIQSRALFDNPICNAQCSFLLFFPIGFAFSVYLASFPETTLLALIYCAATVIYGTSLFIMVIHKWFDMSIRLDYYHEIIDFIDRQRNA